MFVTVLFDDCGDAFAPSPPYNSGKSTQYYEKQIPPTLLDEREFIKCLQIFILTVLLNFNRFKKNEILKFQDVAFVFSVTGNTYKKCA